MKRVIISAMLAAGMMSACWSPVKRNYVENINIVKTGIDSTVYGSCLAVRDSNMMLFVSDMGDTMRLSLKRAKIYGFPTPDSQLALMMGDGGAVEKLVNITALMGTWVEADPIEEGFEMGISLLEGGAASSINSRVHSYTRWRFYNGRLLMNSQNDLGGVMGEDIVDTFEILKLEPDSLVMRGSGYDFHYSHPKEADDIENAVEPDSIDYMQMLLGY